MSRMDRYKHIHENSEPVKDKKTFNPRKERSEYDREREEQTNYSYDNYEQQSQYRNDEFEQQNQYRGQATPPPNYSTKKGPKKPKKKRRRISWPKRIGLFLLLLIVLAVAFFFKGKSEAENDTSLPKEQQEEFNGVTSADGSKNILLLGSDTRGEDAGRADTIMVLQMGSLTKKPKLISFMRDSYVDIPGVGATKINAAYAYGGAELVRQTLKENFGIDCKYYAKVDFQSFEKIVDSMFPKGVKIDAEKDLNLDGVDIFKGEQSMSGHVLLQYARFRMDEEGDFGRVRRQQQVMSAVMGQMKNPLVLVRTPESLGKFVGYMSTNLPTSFLLMNGPILALKGSGGIDRLTVPVDDSWSYGEDYESGSYLQINFDQNRQVIENFLSQ